MIDPSERKWDRLQNLPWIALNHLNAWTQAARKQAERILEDNPPESSRRVDGYLFILALRQVLRAAEMVAGTVESSQVDDVKSAIDRFNKKAPPAKDMRDILDHFDDYSRGVGNLSHPGVKPGKRTASEEAAMMFESNFEATTDGSYIIHCGPLSLDVRGAEIAAYSLFSEIQQAIGLEEVNDEEIAASIGPVDPGNPIWVAIGFVALLTSHDLSAEGVSQLQDMVTPESRGDWGDFQAARQHISGYTLTSHPSWAAPTVAHIKLVPEAIGGRVATNSVAFIDSLWLTLERRPDLNNGWHAHSVAPWPIPPEQLPLAHLHQRYDSDSTES